MTTTATRARSAPGAMPFKGNRPRWATPVIVAVVMVAVALAMTVLSPGNKGNNNDLDPANPGHSGTQGLANVLRDHGVTVTVVRSQRELLAERLDGSTTLVVTPTLHLSARTAKIALTHAGTAAGVVLLDPDAEVTEGMNLPVDSHLADLSDVTAGCTDAAVGQELRLARAGRAYTPTTDPSDTSKASGNTSCFPDQSDGGGAMLRLPSAEPGRPPVILLGDDSLISNGAILDADNAAIALRLFGQTGHLVWYVPSLADIAASDRSSRSIAPPWFEPGLAIATSAVVFLCLWRGRRLGPLVTEPLPVIVRAVETTESRGRMYRRARDRTRALAVLQLATRRRLAAYLGISVSSPVSSVAAAAAATSGRRYQDVLDLLSSPAAHDDSSLLELANALVALEKEVRRP